MATRVRAGWMSQSARGSDAYNVSWRDGTLKHRAAGCACRLPKTSFFRRLRRSRLHARKILSLPSNSDVWEGCHVARRNPGRQVRARQRPRLPDRHAGAGAPADDAAPARPRRRAQHRRLHLRLSRLAARRLRPGAVAGQALHQEQPHRVPARRQRGPGRDRPVGHPADPSLSRRPLRRRVRHVVRQGARRRPLGRRAEARQLRRHLAARRRAGAGRRRPHGQVVDRRAPERACLHRRRHPGHPCRLGPGVSRLRPARLRPVALLGPVGRLQGAERDGRFLGLGPRRPAPRRDPHADRFHPAAGRAAHPLAGRLARPGASRRHRQAAGRAGLLARQPARPGDAGPP